MRRAGGRSGFGSEASEGLIPVHSILTFAAYEERTVSMSDQAQQLLWGKSQPRREH